MNKKLGIRDEKLRWNDTFIHEISKTLNFIGCCSLGSVATFLRERTAPILHLGSTYFSSLNNFIRKWDKVVQGWMFSLGKCNQAPHKKHDPMCNSPWEFGLIFFSPWWKPIREVGPSCKVKTSQPPFFPHMILQDEKILRNRPKKKDYCQETYLNPIKLFVT
jgi:hypothetical protein